MTLTAHAETRDIMTSLRRAGWGPLGERDSQGFRTTLDALVALLPYGSGQGLVTAPQVADTARLSERWVRRCMARLEDMGLITWRRGGVTAGEPVPSWVRIHKTALIGLIDGARSVLAAVRAVRAELTRARIAGLHHIRGRNRRSDHAELSACLPTPTGEVPPSPPPVVDNTPPDPAERVVTDAARRPGETWAAWMARVAGGAA